MKKGFTLAEVLVTLAIVGVVAAVSLPTLNTNVQKQGLSSQIAKFYNQFSKAIDMYKVDNEVDKIPTSFDSTEFVSKYFKVTQLCSQTAITTIGTKGSGPDTIYSASCFAPSYRTVGDASKKFNGSTFEAGGPAKVEGEPEPKTYMLADGAIMTIKGDIVTFDVNGSKGPNIIGYDLQQFKIHSDGSLDEEDMTPEVRLNNSATVNSKISTAFAACKAGTKTYGCFGHLLRNGFRFDY